MLMFNKSNEKYRIGRKYSKFYKNQLNKIIIVLLILIIILIIKIFNNNTSNKVIEVIEENIYYEFNWKSDGEIAIKYMTKLVANAKKTMETINIQIRE